MFCHRSALAVASLSLAALFAPGCGTPPGGDTSGSTTASAQAPKAPPPETTLFAPSKAILADLPVLQSLPNTVTAVFAMRDPATALAKLTTLTGFAEAKDPIAKEVDSEIRLFSKDLPEIASLAQNGVDLAKPVGLAWFDSSFETVALFASVSDEAAVKKWMDERSKLANGKRPVTTVGSAQVLRAKNDVTRAMVLRNAHVFWVRTKDNYKQDDPRVVDASDAIAKTENAASLGADPSFTKAVSTLAYGNQAALFVNVRRTLDLLSAERKTAAEEAQKDVTAAESELAKATTKKRKKQIEEAERELKEAQNKKVRADKIAKDAEPLLVARQEIPALAAGIELSDRDIRFKAFLVAESSGTPTIFTAPKFTRPLFDESIKAKTVAQFSLDPQVVEFVVNHFRLTMPYWDAVPTSNAYTSLRLLGVETAEIQKTLGHEISTATHAQLGQGQPRFSVTNAPSAAPSSEPSNAPASNPSAAPSAGAAPDRSVELNGYTVVWQVTDRARLATLLDEGFKSAATTDRVAKGTVKRLNESTFEISGGPGQLAVRIVLAENTLTVSTLDEAQLAALSKPATSTFGAAEHPTLIDLARIENALGVLAFEGLPWRRSRYAMWGDDIGMLGRLSAFGLFSGNSKKAEKLRERRNKLDDQLRLLERELSREKQAAWDAIAKRFGKTVVFAKQESGGIAFYGGVFPRDPNLTALAQAAVDTWLSVGPRWAKWNEMADLKKQMRDIDDQLEAEMQSSMGALVGDVLKGLGADDASRGGVLGLDPNSGFGGLGGLGGLGGIGTPSLGGGAPGPGFAGGPGTGKGGTAGGSKKP